MIDFEEKAKEVRGAALKAAYHGTGWNIATATKELDTRIAQALREAYESGLAASAEVVQIFAEGGNIENYGVLSDRLDALKENAPNAQLLSEDKK